MIESVVTSNGRITLPKVVREALGVHAGDQVRYIIFADAVRVFPVRPINRLFGVLQHADPSVRLEEMEQAKIS